jgi:hypothetical protein
MEEQEAAQRGLGTYKEPTGIKGFVKRQQERLAARREAREKADITRRQQEIIRLQTDEAKAEQMASLVKREAELREATAKAKADIEKYRRPTAFEKFKKGAKIVAERYLVDEPVRHKATHHHRRNPRRFR